VATKLKKRIDEIKALKVEVVIRQPTTAYASRNYYGAEWNWTTSFSAKNNTGGFTLTSYNYEVTNRNHKWTTGSGVGNTVSGYKQFTVEKGKSYSYKQGFQDSEAPSEIGFRGGVFNRIWSGEDEYGNKITVQEQVFLR
jgi:hypothetical protein